MIVPGTCDHPAYGIGSLLSFNLETMIGHFIFFNPPGMVHKVMGGVVVPTAEMALVDGIFLPILQASGIAEEN